VKVCWRVVVGGVWGKGGGGVGWLSLYLGGVTFVHNWCGVLLGGFFYPW